MKKIILLTLLSTNLFASDYESSWGNKLADNKLKIGGRMQGIAYSSDENQDFYLRRVRLNIAYKPWENHQVVYDIRNDNANVTDKGEGKFQIGDAYWEIKLPEISWIKNIRFFRAKVDVSYSQTSSSKHLFNPNRTHTSEKASDFVVHNRRATNIQLNGHYKNLAYQAVISDGVQSGDLDDLSGNEVDAIEKQKFSYGGKLRYYFIGDANKNAVQDTFYGNLETFSLGLGHFRNDKISITNSNSSLSEVSFARDMTNLELSMAYHRFRLLSEYFEFNGDIVDLTATSKDDMFSRSKGHYAQLEYYFGNWAPFVMYETFEKNVDLKDSTLNSNAVGINFYEMLDARRYGLVYKETKYDQNLNKNNDFEIYAYIMLNF